MIRMKAVGAFVTSIICLAPFGTAYAAGPPNSWETQLSIEFSNVNGACSSIPTDPEYWPEYVECMSGMWTSVNNQYAYLLSVKQAACSSSTPPSNCTEWLDYYNHLVDEAAAQCNLWMSS